MSAAAGRAVQTVGPGSGNYTWDAENRLLGITYPGQPRKETAFGYDGLGRSISIVSTPAGGGAAITSNYVWCGARICQARNGANAVTRSYHDEGEFVRGTPAQSLYHGTDQTGSVRRVFASATSAPAYSYDPYGVPLQRTAPLADFNYAGMLYNSAAGSTSPSTVLTIPSQGGGCHATESSNLIVKRR